VERIPEPAPADPDWMWSAYFDDQIRVIEEDLRRERTSLGKELAKFSGRKPKSDQDRRTERWCRQYLAELRAAG
jgi:hypothetical protein